MAVGTYQGVAGLAPRLCLCCLCTVYAVYAISSLDTGVPLRPHPKATIVGTYQGVAGLAPRLFTLEEETGSHHGHGHVHRTRMLICMHNWGSSLYLPPHRRSSIIVIGICTHSRSRVPRGCRRQRRRDRLVLLAGARMTHLTRRRGRPLRGSPLVTCRLLLAAPPPLPLNKLLG